MQMMGGGLEAAAGNKMKKILEKLTANRFLGVLVGAGITAVIQSSAATTVMVVGFVNSGMMTLRQAVWIIMGANIGHDYHRTVDCSGYRYFCAFNRFPWRSADRIYQKPKGS